MKRDRDSNETGSSRSRKPYLLVGSGPLTATIWKSISGDGDWNYRFNVVRTNSRSGRVTQQFVPRNVLHLAKLVQVLAAALADDGCLAAETRHALQDLAIRLEPVVRKLPTVAKQDSESNHLESEE